MAREIVLDTETTGFDPRTGDRLIEVRSRTHRSSKTSSSI